MFKPRFSFKNIILSTNIIHVAISNTFSMLPPSFKPKFEKILVVSKLSLYEFERNKCRDLTDEEFKEKLIRRGTDVETLKHFHNLHNKFEIEVIHHLKKIGVDIKIVNRISCTNELVDWADLILPVGGDGTFLLAASRISNNRKPVMGFNSNPSRSEGYLCLPKYYSSNILEAIRKLQSGSFHWLLRSRIRTTLCGQEEKLVPTYLHLSNDKHLFCSPVKYVEVKRDDKTVLPFLALNEVFMGESLSARVSFLEMNLDDEKISTNMKCSGICVSTGTGSTSWNLSINRISEQTIHRIVRLMTYQPLENNENLATLLADKFNKELIFNPDDERLAYSIRDLISAAIWPQPKGIKANDFAFRVKVKSRCLDGCLVMDGGISLPFNNGCTAVLEIRKEDALRTVVLD